LPLKNIRVKPLAAESLGVRSMCTYVETPEVRILLDPGVALGPRFRLLPHPIEYKALSESRERILEYAAKAEVVTASHYHFDHVSPPLSSDSVWTWSSKEVAQQIYGDKILLLKDIRERISFSQRKRGWIFRKVLEPLAKKVLPCDGTSFSFGDTKLRFSDPVVHGEEGGGLGWVVLLKISRLGESFMFCPDVQGPMSQETLNLILSEKPDMAMVGGPPLYLAGFRVSEESVRMGIYNLAKLTKVVRSIILDHHLLRDINWRSFAAPAYEEAALNDCQILTAAESLGLSPRILEAQRRNLYESEPPSEAFERWLRLPHEKRRLQKPPL
jgi:predicted metallo-beta-lactamase superfamily hydrolase